MVDFEPGMMTSRVFGRDRLARLDEVHGDARFQPQRIEIIEIGDAGQAQNRNHDSAPEWLASVSSKRHCIFGGEVPRLGEMRHDAEAGRAGAGFEKAPSFRKEFRIAVELVDQEAFQLARGRPAAGCRRCRRSRR